MRRTHGLSAPAPGEATLSRRAVLAALGGSALGIAAAGLPRAARAEVGTTRRRVVVAGGGIAGVATAWLLDGQHDVTLLEADRNLGGHARGVDVDVHGQRLAVDVGAQYFSARSHPAYWQLVTSVLDVPVVATRMDLTVTKHGKEHPVFVSPHSDRLGPLANPRNLPAASAMGLFTHRARQLEAEGDWSLTTEEFVEELHVPSRLKEKLLYPLTASMFGCSTPDVKTMSARAAVAFLARVAHDDRLTPPEYHNATHGLRSVIDALASRFTTVTPLVDTAAMRLTRQGGEYQVVDSTGRVHRADDVVLALPPYAAGRLARQLAGGERVARICDRFPYFPATVVIHRDPAYMPADRADWSAYNATVDGDWCEATMWFGAIRGVEVFKSWATHRREPPRQVVTSHDFRHALITPDFLRAQTALAEVSGQAGLYFAGSHTTDVASQESALLSALRVARRLAPTAPNLARLQAFL